MENAKKIAGKYVSSINTTVGDVVFNSCIWNAAGPRCTSVEELDILKECDYVGAIVTKTCTLHKREGNVFPRVHTSSTEQSTISINSVGLANMGIDEYLLWIANAKQDGMTKPIFLSIGGLSIEENKELLRKICEAEYIPDFIELNLSCPNLIAHAVVGYSYYKMEQYLDILTINVDVMRKRGKDVRCGVKLPPYFDDSEFQHMAKLINTFSRDLDYVTTINGVPNCLVIDTATEAPMIKPKCGFGGMGGTITKPVGLANVHKLRGYLHESIDIIGCGGVKTGEDVFHYLLCGASAVEIATQFLIEGIECFERILDELKVIMKDKGYRTIADFQGKLHKK